MIDGWQVFIVTVVSSAMHASGTQLSEEYGLVLLDLPVFHLVQRVQGDVLDMIVVLHLVVTAHSPFHVQHGLGLHMLMDLQCKCC